MQDNKYTSPGFDSSLLTGVKPKTLSHRRLTQAFGPFAELALPQISYRLMDFKRITSETRHIVNVQRP